MAFGMYAGQAAFTKGFLTDSRKRTAEINEVAEQGDSLGQRVALFDALHQGLKMFGPHQPGDTILLIGSPYDDKSKHSVDSIRKEILRSGTRVMIMLREPLSHVGRDFGWKNHDSEKEFFRQLTAKSGGGYSDFDAHFFKSAWNAYLLGVKMPSTVRRPQSWKVRFRGSNFRNTKLFYPEKLSPCGDEEAEPQAATDSRQQGSLPAVPW